MPWILSHPKEICCWCTQQFNTCRREGVTSGTKGRDDWSDWSRSMELWKFVQEGIWISCSITAISFQFMLALGQQWGLYSIYNGACMRKTTSKLWGVSHVINSSSTGFINQTCLLAGGCRSLIVWTRRMRFSFAMLLGYLYLTYLSWRPREYHYAGYFALFGVKTGKIVFCDIFLMLGSSRAPSMGGATICVKL